VGALPQEPAIPSADTLDRAKFRVRTLDVIGTYSPLPTTLLDNPLIGQINTFVIHSLLPDGLPVKNTRS
jgi:hypothetical protein